jgi:HD-like signal output (HDOD) protein
MTMKNSPTLASIDRTLERTIRELDIPPRPKVIDHIRAEMGRETPDLPRLAMLIGRDVSLGAGLIKTANSPYFGFAMRARSVSDALIMLGLHATSQAIAAISLRRAFPNSGHYERFWHSSAAIATLSGWLAQRLGRRGLRADDAFTFGLFRDCGIVILLRRFPGYMATLRQANGDAERSFTAIEQTQWPTNHAVVGSLLALNWWLPEHVMLAIRHHHEPLACDDARTDLPDGARPLIAIAQVAEYLLQQLTGMSHTEEWPKLGEWCLRELDLEYETLTGWFDAARLQLDAIE